MILIHPISPVAIDLFGFGIRWYAIAYIAAFLLGLWQFKKISNNEKHDKAYYDDLLTHVILGVIIGGRLGYVLFYNFPFFLDNPSEVFMVWHGGMSFHGGLLGVIAAVFLFSMKISKKNKKSSLNNTFLKTMDKMAVVAPIGLFLGRIANFINMEVMGRITNVPWGVVFANDPNSMPRHPSPLYEATMEGIVLFLIMKILWHKTNFKNNNGKLSGFFLIFYGTFRILCEQFREPDAQLGFLLGTDWLTMGTVLSSIMIIIGVYLTFTAKSSIIPQKPKEL